MLINEGEVRAFLSDIVKKPHDTNHRIIIERYVRVIAFPQWVELRPPAIGILGFQEIVKPSEKRISIPLLTRCLKNLSQESELGVCCAIIDGRAVEVIFGFESCFLIGAQHRRHVDIFRPTAGGILIQKHILCNPLRLTA